MKYEMNISYQGPENGTLVRETADKTVFVARIDSGRAEYEVSFSMNLPVEDGYILIPACAYDGNRFEAVRRSYPPMFTEEELGKNVPLRMTQVPRLSKAGDSYMDVTTGDMATPCVLALNRKTREAFAVFFEQGAHGRNHGVSLEQTGDILTIRLQAPARRREIYRWFDGYPSLRQVPGEDPALCVTAGTETVISHRVFTFACEDIPALYQFLFEKSREMYTGAVPPCLPFSAFYDMVENLMNRAYYVEEEAFYALEDQRRAASPYATWQPGWVGGGMTTLPLLCGGNALSRERAVKTLAFTGRVQSEKGWYYGVYNCRDGVRDDSFRKLDEKNLVLVRKQTDLAWFMARQIMLLQDMGMDVPEAVLESAVKAANALADLWKRERQLGQFVNAETGEIVVGGSAAGGTGAAALCAMACLAERMQGVGKMHPQMFSPETYARYAGEIGEFFHETAILPGITCGGPGEILQAPDSESAAGLMESYMALYEHTKEAKWLRYAEEAAHQTASWIVTYDYAFPADSKFGRMDVHTVGSVWANVQNKHSAPGLCTASPAAFLKLYRATGNERYLQIMQQVARFSPQTASRPDRPVYDMGGRPLSPGEMCERVNMSDWEGVQNVGDAVFGPSGWPQAAMMLTAVEIPGVYVFAERGILCVSDHVEAEMENGVITISNPTAYDARVSVMTETEETVKAHLGMQWQDRFDIVHVPAGGTARMML